MGSLSRNIKLRYVIPALIALAMVGYGVATSSLNTHHPPVPAVYDRR